MRLDPRTERLVEVIEAAVPVNLTNAAGDSLLILAAYHRHAATVRALLAAGADTARVNDRGQTALAAATFRQDAGIVRLLLAAGADRPRSSLGTGRRRSLRAVRDGGAAAR